MRIALAVAVAAGCLAVAPPAAPTAWAEPAGNCPPACNRIPDSAWISAAAIPLHSRYDWADLSGLAVSSRRPTFRFESLCAAKPLAEDPRSFAVAERSTAISPDGQWQLQSQILHWRGEGWWTGQLAGETLAAASAALRGCQLGNPTASPSITLSDPDRLAAVVSGPVILHQYLLADRVSGTVTELALWSTAPPATPYPTVTDSDVLDALGAPLCTAYIGSCA